MGLSYRVVYRADPVPYNKTKSKRMLGQEELVHVHGEIFCDPNSCRPGTMTLPDNLSPDYDDHAWGRYQQVQLFWLARPGLTDLALKMHPLLQDCQQQRTSNRVHISCELPDTCLQQPCS